MAMSTSVWMVALLAAPLANAAERPDRPAAYYEFSLGQQARLAGRLDEALEHYRKAQQADPGSADLHTEMARLLREAGQTTQALAEAREAVRLDKDNLDAHEFLAEVLRLEAMRGGGTAAALEAATALEDVLRLRPGDDQVTRALAEIYRQAGRPADAARVWEKQVEADPRDVDALQQLGLHYFAQGQSERALATLQRALEIDPTSTAVVLALAEIYEDAEQTEQAVLHYRKALELESDVDKLRVRLKLGDLLLRARRAKEGLAEADVVLAADAENRFALDIKGRALRDLRRFDEAQAVADQLLSKDPNDLGSAFLKVTVAEARRDFAGAATELERLLKRPRRPENAEKDTRDDRTLLVHLGAAYQRLDRQREAAETFARAKATGGEPDATLLAHYVEALMLAKDNERALVEVRAARKRFADDEDLTALEANLLDDAGDKSGAGALMEGLRTKSPQDVGVLMRVAQFHQRARRFPDAEAVLRQARELEPRNQNALFVLGAVLERQKRFDAAESVFREALAVQPEFAPALNYLGYMNADRKVKLAEAVTLIEKAVALDPENGAYLDSLGWALYRQGRLTEAEDYLRRAVVKESGAVVLDHLGDVLGRQGKTAEALDFWNRALTGEDEDGELDRARVAEKIKDAQARLGQAAPVPQP